MEGREGRHVEEGRGAQICEGMGGRHERRDPGLPSLTGL
jgi:hypothetical protein